MKNAFNKLSILITLTVLQITCFTPNHSKTYASSNPITISNFRNNETITYELPIIKGTINTYADKVKVSVNNGAETEWTVHPAKYTFKAIAQLNQGMNIIKLSADGNDDTYLRITYNPPLTGPSVKFIYLIPSDIDGSFRAPFGVDNSLDSAKKRYTVQALLMQSAWAECMYDRGYGRNTFRIKRPIGETSNVVFVKTADKTEAQIREYSNENFPGRTNIDLYNYVKSQVSPHPYDIKNFVIPSSSTLIDEFLPNGEIISQASTALGGNDLALGESTYLYKMPEHISDIDSILYNTDIGIETDPYPYWEQFGLSIGGGLHELGHCFGLDHLDSSLMIDWDNPETIKPGSDNSSIMTSGFRKANRIFAVKDGNGVDFEDDVNQVNWNWGWTETENPANSFVQNECQVLSDSEWIFNSSLFDEAEWDKNTICGDAQIFHNTTPSGNVVGNIGGGFNNSLTFNDIYTDKSGNYTIRVYYIPTQTRSCFISVNEDTGVKYIFEGNNSSEPVYKEISLYLQSGYNTIKFYNIDSWAPDIDKISLPFTLSDSLPLNFEAEAACNSFHGDVQIWIDSIYSGCKAVGSIIGKNILVFNNVAVDKTGDYTVRVSYITDEDRTCNISTNHDKEKSYLFEGYDWSSVSTKDITLTLREGNNRIKFFNDNGYAPDIDKIEIIGIPSSKDTHFSTFEAIQASIRDITLSDNNSSSTSNKTVTATKDLPYDLGMPSYNNKFSNPYSDMISDDNQPSSQNDSTPILDNQLQVPLPAVNVEYFNINSKSPTNQIKTNIKITNSSSEAINLSDLKVKYYYTINGINSQNFFCDYASINDFTIINPSNVTGNFVELTKKSAYADHYIEIRFINCTQVLYPGDFVNICTRISKSDWSNTYIQEDDYSYVSSPMENLFNTPVYISGARVFGTEP